MEYLTETLKLEQLGEDVNGSLMNGSHLSMKH